MGKIKIYCAHLQKIQRLNLKVLFKKREVGDWELDPAIQYLLWSLRHSWLSDVNDYGQDTEEGHLRLGQRALSATAPVFSSGF